jgi:hypothetical protein
LAVPLRMTRGLVELGEEGGSILMFPSYQNTVKCRFLGYNNVMIQ